MDVQRYSLARWEDHRKRRKRGGLLTELGMLSVFHHVVKYSYYVLLIRPYEPYLGTDIYKVPGVIKVDHPGKTILFIEYSKNIDYRPVIDQIDIIITAYHEGFVISDGKIEKAWI